MPDPLVTIGTLLLIFSLRIVDVSAGVVRVMLLVRGKRWPAAAIGFVESMTWLVAAVAVIGTLDSPFKAIAYAGGFAAGTAVGSIVEERLAVGKAVLRIFVPYESASPSSLLRSEGFGVTEVQGEGMRGQVRILFSVVPRRRVKDLMAIIAVTAPDAYVTVEDIATVDPTHRRFQRQRP
jgi:uncharacterized protein YebE (UPF0316 family)